MSLGNPFVILPQKIHKHERAAALVTGFMFKKSKENDLDGVSIAITMLVLNLVFPFQINNDMLDGWLNA